MDCISIRLEHRYRNSLLNSLILINTYCSNKYNCSEYVNFNIDNVKMTDTKSHYIYVISNDEHRRKGEYKIGFWSGYQNVLISRYRHHHPNGNVLLHLYIETPYEDKRHEKEILEFFDKDRVVNDNGKITENIKRPLNEIINRIMIIVNSQNVVRISPFELAAITTTPVVTTRVVATPVDDAPPPKSSKRSQVEKLNSEEGLPEPQPRRASVIGRMIFMQVMQVTEGLAVQNKIQLQGLANDMSSNPEIMALVDEVEGDLLDEAGFTDLPAWQKLCILIGFSATSTFAKNHYKIQLPTVRVPQPIQTTVLSPPETTPVDILAEINRD